MISKSILRLGTAIIALQAGQSLACTTTISSTSTLTGTITCQQELTFGTLTVAGTLSNGGEPATLRALTHSADDAILIQAGGSVIESGTSFSNNSALAIGDGTGSYLLGKVENWGSILNPEYQANEKTLIIYGNATLNSLINHAGATINVTRTGGGGGGAAVRVRGTLGALVNDGLMQDRATVINVESGSSVDSITNSASGVMRTVYTGQVFDLYGPVGSLTNAGLIDSLDYYAISMDTGASIDHLVNTGTMTYNGDPYGATIANWNGTIHNFDNYQGATGSGGAALVYTGYVPENYNVILSGAGYGQLALNAAAGFVGGTLSFGISTQSGKITQLSYGAVLSGLSAAHLAATTGQITVGGSDFDWELRETATGSGIWDLWFLGLPSYGPAAEATRTQIETLARATGRQMRAATGGLIPLLDTDCTRFGARNHCLSGGTLALKDSLGGQGRLLRLATAIRVGAMGRAGLFLDWGRLSASDSAVHLAENGPAFGLFAGFGAEDGLGLQGFAAATTRAASLHLARAPADGAEPGEGSADLRLAALRAEAGNGLALRGWTVTPYGGLRFAAARRAAYVEGTDSDTQSPVAYDAFTISGTSAQAGLRLKGALSPRQHLNAAIGLEQGLSGHPATFGFDAQIDDLGTSAIRVDGDGKATALTASVALDSALSDSATASLGLAGRADPGAGRDTALVWASVEIAL